MPSWGHQSLFHNSVYLNYNVQLGFGDVVTFTLTPLRS